MNIKVKKITVAQKLAFLNSIQSNIFKVLFGFSEITSCQANNPPINITMTKKDRLIQSNIESNFPCEKILIDIYTDNSIVSIRAKSRNKL